MRKEIGLLFLLLCVAVSAYSAPAYPGLVTKQQPNGEEVSVYLKGDEKIRWMESEDGYTLLYDNQKQIVYATLSEDGDLVPSAIPYRNASLRSSDEEGLIASIPKSLFYSSSQVETMLQLWKMTEDAQLRISTNSTSVTGARKAVCVLVGFPDKAFRKTQAEVEALMNQIGYSNNLGAQGSVRDFFFENSYGQLDFQVTVLGPYTASNEWSYYGKNNSSGYDSNPQVLVREIAQKAFQEVDAAEYDHDGDGYIDSFHFLFAGHGEEAGADADAIWSHMSSLSPAVIFQTNAGAKRLSVYSCSPELQGNSGSNLTHIGVIAHELCHGFGAPDFYDANGSTGGSYNGTGKWDLMANGSWNGANSDGASPAHINMYQKIQFGWVEPVTLHTDQTINALGNSADNPEAYIFHTQTDGEYFVMENRQQVGFDTYIPGTGLLIYRVSLTNSHISQNTVNNTHPQRMYPVCASSYTAIPSSVLTYGSINSRGCPFPGSSGKTRFADDSSPSAMSWAKVNTEKEIYDIAENSSNRTISFKFKNHAPTSSVEAIPLSELDPDTLIRIYNLQGMLIQTTTFGVFADSIRQAMQQGVYIIVPDNGTNKAYKYIVN